jgi:hypothetical protein
VTLEVVGQRPEFMALVAGAALVVLTLLGMGIVVEGFAKDNGGTVLIGVVFTGMAFAPLWYMVSRHTGTRTRWTLTETGVRTEQLSRVGAWEGGEVPWTALREYVVEPLPPAPPRRLRVVVPQGILRLEALRARDREGLARFIAVFEERAAGRLNIWDEADPLPHGIPFADRPLTDLGRVILGVAGLYGAAVCGFSLLAGWKLTIFPVGMLAMSLHGWSHELRRLWRRLRAPSSSDPSLLPPGT